MLFAFTLPCHANAEICKQNVYFVSNNHVTAPRVGTVKLKHAHPTMHLATSSNAANPAPWGSLMLEQHIVTKLLHPFAGNAGSMFPCRTTRCSPRICFNKPWPHKSSVN
ncbi:hypothetical protein BaRGS_00002944 [Batillaria attramentaria]|uniref:Uncharacterized protein n=1 Tax=Batillaria attramentaria TaxID=370345 RepID=A0ABD0M1W3_9CAEN